MRSAGQVWMRSRMSVRYSRGLTPAISQVVPIQLHQLRYPLRGVRR